MKLFLQGLRQNNEGNALMLFAAALIPVTIMIGSGLDASIAYTTRGKMQTACDAGVLAARTFMKGEEWTTDVEEEGRKFFNFNFPEGTNGVTKIQFDISQDEDDPVRIDGTATAELPTSMMYVFGRDAMDLSVNCQAASEPGSNDIMLILDLTRSMLSQPSWGGGTSKVDLLRSAVQSLYETIPSSDGTNSVTRFGFMPFSQTVNVGRSLQNSWILRNQYMVDGTTTKTTTSTTDPATGKTTYTTNTNFTFAGLTKVGARESSFNNGQNGASNENGIIQGFRTSGQACIEERPHSDYDAEGQYNYGEFVIGNEVTRLDTNRRPRNGSDSDLQWGRYEPDRQKGWVFKGCPPEAIKLTEYADKAAFMADAESATAYADGGTVADIGMLWGFRFAIRQGIFAENNPKYINNRLVNVNLIFFTDGQMYLTDQHYTAYGIERYTHRVLGDGTAKDEPVNTYDLIEAHNERFLSICQLAKAYSMRVWVVVLDTEENDYYKRCATSPEHYFYSDGTDLDEKFIEIGRGITGVKLSR